MRLMLTLMDIHAAHYSGLDQVQNRLSQLGAKFQSEGMIVLLRL